MPSAAKIATAHLRAGRLAEAERVLFNVKRARHGIGTIDCLSALAVALDETGDLPGAVRVAERACVMSAVVLGSGDPRAVGAKKMYIMAAYNTGELARIAPVAEDCLKLEIALHGRASDEVAITLSTLTTIYINTGKLEKAASRAREALDVAREVHGKGSLKAMRAHNALFLVEGERGLHEESVRLGKECLEAEWRMLGEDHSLTVCTMHNLASALARAGNSDEAILMSQRCLRAKERLYGPAAQSTLVTMNSCVAFLCAANRFSEAAIVGRKCAERMEEEHSLRGALMDNLFVALFMTNQHAEAAKIGRQCLCRASRLLGPEHPETVSMMSNLVWTLSRCGAHSEVVVLGRQCLHLKTKIFGERHVRTLDTMQDLLSALAHEEHIKEAVLIGERCLSGRAEVLGHDHPDTLQTMESMARIYHCAGMPEKAAEVGLECLQVHKTLFGKKSPGAFRVKASLVLPLSDSKDRGMRLRGAKMGTQCLTYSMEAMGMLHDDTIQMLGRLAIALWRGGLCSQAIDTALRCAEWCAQRPKTPPQSIAFASMVLGDAVIAGDMKAERAVIVCEAYEGLEELLPPDRRAPELSMRVMQGHAGALCALGRAPEAVGILRRCWRVAEERAGVYDARTLLVMYRLSALCSRSGIQEEAVHVARELLSRRKDIFVSMVEDGLAAIHEPGSAREAIDAENARWLGGGISPTNKDMRAVRAFHGVVVAMEHFVSVLTECGPGRAVAFAKRTVSTLSSAWESAHASVRAMHVLAARSATLRRECGALEEILSEFEAALAPRRDLVH